MSSEKFYFNLTHLNINLNTNFFYLPSMNEYEMNKNEGTQYLKIITIDILKLYGKSVTFIFTTIEK